jgi:hypothetical protein
VHLNVANEPVKALSFERIELRPGMQVGINVDPSRIHLFDLSTEQRIN